MMRSLKSRLLLGVGLSSTLVLIASGVVLYLLIRGALVSEFDRSLLESARTLAALVENEDGRIHSEMAEREMPQFARRDRPDYYEIWQADGTMLEQSDRLKDDDLPRLAQRVKEPRFEFVTLPDGRPGRIVALTFVPKPEISDEASDANATPDSDLADHETAPLLSLAIARDTIDLDRSIARVQWTLVAVLSAAVLVALLTASLIVHIGLKPLRKSATQIEKIDGASLSTRFDAASAPVEVRSVVERLNGLLDRLGEAFQREQAFSSNVAHELRTPLAGLRSTMEVALFKPRQPADYEHALSECLTICKETESLTENLLVLARLDAGECQSQKEAVALNTLLRRAWSALATRAESRGLDVVWQLDTETQLNTDPALLSLILRNLFDNAVSYAEINGKLNIGVRVEQCQVAISIKNTASGLSADLSQHVFDRFWRGDAARAATGRHAGLGLSLCQEATRAIGGELNISTTEDWFTACLLLAT